MGPFEDQNKKSPIHIVTYRDIFIKVSQEIEPFGINYIKRSAVIDLAPGDMKDLGIQTDSNVRLRNDFGVVVVRAKSNPDCPRGYAYMPVSLYSNVLVSYDPEKTKFPTFKRIEAFAEPTEEAVTSVSDLLSPKLIRGVSDA